jgi:hypothetical protein
LSYLLPESLSGLQGVTEQETQLFTVTSVKASNLKGFYSYSRAASLQFSSIPLEEVKSFMKDPIMLEVLLFSFPFYRSLSSYFSYHSSFFVLYLSFFKINFFFLHFLYPCPIFPSTSFVLFLICSFILSFLSVLLSLFVSFIFSIHSFSLLFFL